MRYDLYTVNCTHWTAFSLSFDRSMYLWHHHHYQDIIHFHHLKSFLGIFPVAQTLKNLPAMQETQVRFLDWEDPLEKGMAIHSSIVAWRIPRTEEPGGPQSIASQRVGHDWSDWTRTHRLKKRREKLANSNIWILFTSWFEHTKCMLLWECLRTEGIMW